MQRRTDSTGGTAFRPAAVAAKPAGEPRVRAGFSLVELLVVVAILSLLLAIFSPCLRWAKELSRRAVCKGNLHQIVVGVGSYAAGRDGRLPPGHISGDAALEQSWQTYLAYTNTKVAPSGKMLPWNLAIAYEAGSISDWRALYCPSQRSVLHRMSNWTLPWGESVAGDPKKWAIRTCYNYNPHVEDARHRYPRLPDVPADAVLAMDLLAFDISWHTDAFCHGEPPGWHRAFAGGHVDFRQSEEALDFIYEHAFGTSDVGHDWQQFEICLGMLGR